ncbi:DUF2848 domain-containing protein [Bradyrhizobium sp. 151]|uniref:DUF2848 domain-containing protein n=1 Tax=Bradyrhizobium sp. 151 TaxID=2782626 RepID=UPI001FF86580|nr:DUF2848 domain-containing protein [Bradyrhizobium sp. 151]MCK1661263.1 DUF2848 domain-containing protein [Bradyrhizobium sp. 151]
MATHDLWLRSLRSARWEERTVTINQCVIAGWTGRDRVALEAHIAELEKIGIKRPASVPIFYRVSASRISTAETIEVIGKSSSGEVEFALLQSGGRLWVGVGSDHTDRDAEVVGVTLSKQMCDKPIAGEFWAYDDVWKHWDDLILRSYAVNDGSRVLYQEGALSAIRPAEELIALYAAGGTLTEGTLMLCGTLAVHGEIRLAQRFELELSDPRLRRSIRKAYQVVQLPVLG